MLAEICFNGEAGD